MNEIEGNEVDLLRGSKHKYQNSVISPTIGSQLLESSLPSIANKSKISKETHQMMADMDDSGGLLN